MGFHGPFGGQPYVFLRSPQGLLNQSEELEQLASKVFREGIQNGDTRVQADNIYAMGHTMEEAVDAWEAVLHAAIENNIKFSAVKTLCFPNRMDLLGRIKEGPILSQTEHTIASSTSKNLWRATLIPRYVAHAVQMQRETSNIPVSPHKDAVICAKVHN